MPIHESSRIDSRTTKRIAYKCLNAYRCRTILHISTSGEYIAEEIEDDTSILQEYKNSLDPLVTHHYMEFDRQVHWRGQHPMLQFGDAMERAEHEFALHWNRKQRGCDRVYEGFLMEFVPCHSFNKEEFDRLLEICKKWRKIARGVVLIYSHYTRADSAPLRVNQQYPLNLQTWVEYFSHEIQDLNNGCFEHTTQADWYSSRKHPYLTNLKDKPSRGHAGAPCYRYVFSWYGER